jgi:hypothetical protein
MEDIEKQYYTGIQNQHSFTQKELVNKFFCKVYEEYAKPLRDIINIINGYGKIR